MSVNIFDTEFLLDLILQAKPAKTFLLDAFFRDEKQYKTKKVRIDLWDGSRRIAAYVKRTDQAQHVEKEGYYTEDYEPALLSLVDTTTVEDLLKRQPGEVIMRTPSSPREEAVYELAQQMAEMENMITRAYEKQAQEALFNGTLTLRDINGNTIGSQINFQRSADLAMAAGALHGGAWSNSTNARPLDDVDELRRRIQRLSGMKADYTVLGESAWRYFRNTDQVKDQLDNRRISDGDSIVRQMEASGAIFRGEIEGMKYFTYDEWYIDETLSDREETALIPATKVLVGSSEARATRAYGVVAKIDQQTNGEKISRLYAEKIVPDSWTEKNPDVRLLRLQSAGLMLTHQPNAYGVATIV